MKQAIMQVAFCCRENPCGVLVGTLTSCCLAETITHNVCLIPDEICALTEDGPIIFRGTIDGVDDCWEFDCKIIDHVCGEDDGAIVDGNCCPSDEFITYVEWAAISMNLSPTEEGTTCPTCCDDDPDPPCGPFGSRFTFSYTVQSHTTWGSKAYNDYYYCGYTCGPVNGSPIQEWGGYADMKSCGLSGVNGFECCGNWDCGVSFPQGNFSTPAPTPIFTCSTSDICPSCFPEFNQDECKYQVVGAGPRQSFCGTWLAECNVPRKECSWNSSTQTGSALYEGPGIFTPSYSEYTAGGYPGNPMYPDVLVVPCCASPDADQFFTWIRGQITPGAPITGVWKCSASVTSSSSGMSASFYPRSADGGLGPQLFYYQLNHPGMHVRLSEVFDPGEGDNSYDYAGYNRCGPGSYTPVFGPELDPFGITTNPSRPPNRKIYDPHPEALQMTRVGPSGTSYPRNSWEVGTTAGLADPGCGAWLYSGGRIIQIEMSC
jgi:hypothetical protein